MTRAELRNRAPLNPMGYICKRCAGPAPVGVGYTSYAPGAAAASACVTKCSCGHSGR